MKRLVLLIPLFYLFHSGLSADPSELAARLVAAANATERSKLLEQHPDSIQPALIDAIVAALPPLRIRGEYDKGIELSQFVEKLSEDLKYTKGVAASLNLKGTFFQARDDHPSALKAFRKSFELSEAAGEKKEMATALYSMAIIDEHQANYQEGLAKLKRSKMLYEEIGDKKGVSNALNTMANIEDWMGNHETAIVMYRQSLQLRQEIGDRVAIASSYVNMSGALASIGEEDKARDYLLKAIEIFESAGEKQKLSVVLNNLGNNYSGSGNYRLALFYHMRNLKLSQEIQSHRGTAFAFINIGTIYESQGDYEIARDYYQQAFHLLDKIDNKAIATIALTNIAGIHALEGRYDVALNTFQQAIKRYEEIGDKTGVATLLRSAGQVYEMKGEFKNAQRSLEESLNRHEQLKEPIGIGESSITLANVLIAQRKYSEAMIAARRAYEMATQMKLMNLSWRATLGQGRIHAAQDQLGEARRALEESISVVEEMRLMAAGGEEQQGFLESRIEPYHVMIDVLLRLNKKKEAFSFAERAKARILVDVMKSGKSIPTTGMTREEQEKERLLQARIASLNSQLQSIQGRAEVDQQSIQKIQGQLQKARNEFAIFRTSLYSNHPELISKRGETPPIEISKLSTVLEPDTLYLEYVVAKDQVFLFVLSGKQIHTYTIPLTQKELASRSLAFRKKVAERNLGFRADSASLYKLLLSPVDSQLTGKKRIVIVPDAELWELPFQALITPRQTFLLEEAAISYAPSLTFLAETFKIQRKDRTKLLAFGNPIQNNRVADLKETEQELAMLKQLYHAKNSATFTRNDAREDILKKHLENYDVIHLATHGILNDRSPMYSHLLLAKNGTAEDGLLETWEIMNYKLRASLVVLSACETARGRIKAGEGIVGFTWAFFIAGSPATVVSQWKVEAGSTTQFMREFHRNFKNGEGISKSDALRNAALSVLKKKEYQHPFYWAAFVLVGNHT